MKLNDKRDSWVMSSRQQRTGFFCILNMIAGKEDITILLMIMIMIMIIIEQEIINFFLIVLTIPYLALFIFCFIYF